MVVMNLKSFQALKNGSYEFEIKGDPFWCESTEAIQTRYDLTKSTLPSAPIIRVIQIMSDQMRADKVCAVEFYMIIIPCCFMSGS